jgi:hypothetical protein
MSEKLARCVSCGAPVAFGARACLRCGEARPSMRRWPWLAALLAAFVVWWLAKSAGFAG